MSNSRPAVSAVNAEVSMIHRRAAMLAARVAERVGEAGRREARKHERLERGVVVEVAGDHGNLSRMTGAIGQHLIELTGALLVVSPALEMKTVDEQAGGARAQRDAAATPRLQRIQAPAQRRLLPLVLFVNKAGALIAAGGRSEEHTSELQSRPHLVCRLLP